MQLLPNQSIVFWSGGWVLKPNEKRVENMAVFETISNTVANLLICILIRQEKHVHDDKQLYLWWRPRSFGSLSIMLYTSDLKWQWGLKFPVLRRTLLSTPAFTRLDTHVRHLGIALTTHFSSSSRVLGGLILCSAICFAKQRVRSELTNSNVTTWHLYEYSNIVRAAIRC